MRWKLMMLSDRARKARAALWARFALRRCTRVGALTQVRGRVIVSNQGTMTIGERVRINAVQVPVELAALHNATLSIGDSTAINSGTSICAQSSVRIGSNCGIGNYCLIADTDFHEVGDFKQTRVPDARPVTIGDNVWIAARSIVLKGVTIGEGAVVCAGAVVATNVAPYTMVGGVPARVIGRVTPVETAPERAPADAAEPAAATAEKRPASGTA